MWTYLSRYCFTPNAPTSRTHLLLIHKHHVTLSFLSMLNTNPLRRPSLDTLSRLLECPILWSPVVQDGGEDNGNSEGRTSTGPTYI